MCLQHLIRAVLKQPKQVIRQKKNIFKIMKKEVKIIKKFLIILKISLVYHYLINQEMKYLLIIKILLLPLSN